MVLPERFACQWLVLLFAFLTVGSRSPGEKKNNDSLLFIFRVKSIDLAFPENGTV